MIIDLRLLKQKALTEYNFSFNYNAPNDLLSLPNANFSAPVKVEGTLFFGKTEVFVNGIITFSIDGECSRCLKKACYVGSVEFDEKFVDCSKIDEDSYVYEKDKVDLTQLVNEKIITNAPFGIYCVENCKGLCPTCGADLNISECECKGNL